MSSEINLRVKLISTCINPSLEKEVVISKAKELFGHEEPESEKEFDHLYDTLFYGIVTKANEYLKTSEAQKLYKYASSLDAGSSYSVTIYEKIDYRLEEIYPLSTKKFSLIDEASSQESTHINIAPWASQNLIHLISCVALGTLLIGVKLLAKK